jgi:hypothetical protein
MAIRNGPWTNIISDEPGTISLPSGFQWPLDDLGTQTKVAKAVPRAGNYTHEEDIQLCMSWEKYALMLLLTMSSHEEHIGKELQTITMPTRPLSPIGIPTFLSTVGVPFIGNAISFKGSMVRLSIFILVAYHTKNM